MGLLSWDTSSIDEILRLSRLRSEMSIEFLRMSSTSPSLIEEISIEEKFLEDLVGFLVSDYSSLELFDKEDILKKEDEKVSSSLSSLSSLFVLS